MNIPLFPASLTPDGRKVPLITGWREKATSEPVQLTQWNEAFRDRLKFWGIPTGPSTGLLVLDIDVKGNGFQSIADQGVEIPITRAQRTMSGGAHYLFNYPQDGQRYGNKVGIFPGVDVRGDGGYIIHYGLNDSPVVDAPQWLLDQVVKPPEVLTGEIIKVSPEIAAEMIQASLEAITEAPEGESNNVLNIEAFKVGQLVASGSISREQAEQSLFTAAKERGKPDYEAKATIKSGLDGGGTKPMTTEFGAPVALIDIPPPPEPVGRWTPTFFTPFDLTNTSKLKKPQLFENWSTEDIHITTADGGTGKTTLKLYEAICLALGERFLGFNCIQPGKTLFITGEDSQPKLGAMIGAICHQMGILNDPDKVNTVLSSIVVKKDADLCLINRSRDGFLHANEPALNQVLEAVHDIQPKMIVFDPISSFWGSEAGLNDMAKAVSKFMGRLVDESGACVEMLNHMGKASSANKDMSQFAGRGGSGLPSHARVSRVLRGVETEEYRELTGSDMVDKESALMINVNKFTDGSPLYNRPFLAIRNGFVYSKRDLAPLKQRELEAETSDTERVFNFVKEARKQGKYPVKNVVVGYFMNHTDKLSKDRVTRSLDLLCYQGHMGQLLRMIDNPDVTLRDKIYIIVDAETGKEL